MAFILSILASSFFSITFVLNQLMSVEGGYWLWTASLRFLFMIPFFLVIVSFKKNSCLSSILIAIKKIVSIGFCGVKLALGFFIFLCVLPQL